MCFFSCGKSSSRYRRLESQDTLVPINHTTQPSTAPINMGSAPMTPNQAGAASHFSTQHERLILELLPFKDSAKFHEWIHGDMVRGSWAEFHRDFLTKVPLDHIEPDKNKTADAVKNAISNRSTKFLAYHPDKRNWTRDDHHIRFIVTVIQDNMLTGLWSESEWKKKRNDEIAKAVYEVLFFLKASYYAADQQPPGYTQ